MASRFTVLLYYKYTPVPDPQALADAQRVFCREQGLLGRILIANEGLNGTLAGSTTATDRYREYLQAQPGFADVVFKVSESDRPPFRRLDIRVRREIVTLGATEDPDPNRAGAPHLSPDEWRRAIEQEDVVLFDVRNRYESEVGRFKDAITPPIDHFRDLPQILPAYAHLKSRKVLLYCTGGIRCEKASALFRQAGFTEVFQLEGGIVSYAERHGDAHWEGDCFVFDDRMMIPIGDSANREPFGRCAHTRVPTRHVINCLHDPCHRMFLCAPEAIEQDPDNRLCPDCRRAGLTSATADYLGSPARGPA